MLISNIYFSSLLCLNIFFTNGFNVSPKPNLLIKEPTTGRFQTKIRSSYFGYTLLLKYRSLFVGAPRAQSTLESQRNVNETGLLYKCSLETGSSGHCVVYLIDKTGNQHSEDDEHTIEGKKKDFQWLGGSLDGGSKDTEPMIVCAPRMKAITSEDYLMHGICYRVPNTIDEQPVSIKTISPLKATNQQISGKSFLYAFGQAGISVHWTGIEKDELLLGAPGIEDWKGSVIRYRAEKDKGFGGLQKRDVQASMQDQNRKYVSAIPNPSDWNQPEFSYFGYSESSGYFHVNSNLTLLYVASAPRANNYDGEVYIYDIIRNGNSKDYNIKKYQTFSGEQFGEFFGHSVLTEDVNNDGHTDIIVSAPLYSKSKIYDCGAVYVYLNLGKNFIFDEQLILCPNSDAGRFGTTISLLGDVNQDGYNDLAISAPFSGNGKVYIYLGSKTGLQAKPSQIISAPAVDNINTHHMFGYGISKGLDIDGNGYNDFAVGAPNAEIVYLYKTYPIVKIFSTIDSSSREIQQNQKTLQIKVCFKMLANSENLKKTANQDLNITLTIDPQLKRVRFNNGKYILNEIINLRTDINACKSYDANINFNARDIFKSIEMKMHYDLVNKVPDSEVFCDKCAAIDPSYPNTVTHKIAFSTGCAGEICIADLGIISSNLSETFVLGSSKVLSVEYKIKNSGETAYLPQINVTSSNHMPFAKVPSLCTNQQSFLICDLNEGQPMENGKIDSIIISFDASKIDVRNLDVVANCFSAGKEKNVNDNYIINRLATIEKSSLDIIRMNKNEIKTLEENQGIHEFINKFEIRNNGPSVIKEATISIKIPVSYLKPKTTTYVSIVSAENITLKANYASYQLIPTFYENDKIKPNMILPSNIGENLHANKYDHSKFGYDLEHMNTDSISYQDEFGARKRRHSTESLNKSEIIKIKSARITDGQTVKHELTGSLPIKKVILFQCHDLIESKCIEIKLKVNNFQVSNERGVNIKLKYNVNFDEINNVLINEKEFFFISTEFNVIRTGDEISSESIEIPVKSHYVIISKHLISSTPIWVIILSVIAGLILLAAMAYGMYKLGFFERKEREMLKEGKLENTEQEQPLNSSNAED